MSQAALPGKLRAVMVVTESLESGAVCDSSLIDCCCDGGIGGGNGGGVGGGVGGVIVLVGVVRRDL